MGLLNDFAEWQKRERSAWDASRSVMPEVRQQGAREIGQEWGGIAGLLGSIGKAGRAVVGGQVADANGYFYKGGQFLPSTAAEPGKWKVDGKWIKSGRAEVDTRVYEHQPTPFSRSLYELLGPGAFTKRDPNTGMLGLLEGARDATGAPVSAEMSVRPGVKGVLGKEAYTLQELIDMFNKGMRWLDVNPDAVTKTTK